MKRCYFGLIFILTLIHSCSDEKKSIDEIHLSKPTKAISQLSDSSYLSFIMDLVSYKNNIFIADNNNNRIIILDSLLNVKKTYGRTGKGPGEFNGAANIIPLNDTIYALDDGNNRMHIFSLKDGYISSFNFYKGINPNGYTQMYIDKKKKYIYYTSFSTAKPIIKQAIDSNQYIQFGISKPKSKNYTPPKTQLYHIVMPNNDNNKLYAICHYCPVILEYTREGKLSRSFDLSIYEPIQQKIKAAKETDKKHSGRRRRFFEDVSYLQNSLYLLYTDFTDNPKISRSKLLKVDINNNSFNVDKIIYLGDKENKYTKFCIHNNRIIAFDWATHQLDIYKRFCIFLTKTDSDSC